MLCFLFSSIRKGLVCYVSLLGLDFVFEALFKSVYKCVLPEGLAKGPPKILKIPKSLDLSDCTMVLPITIGKFDAKDTPCAFKHVPGMF